MKPIEKLCFSLCLVFALATPAFAYVDPSVVTTAVQVVAAVAVTVGAVAGVLWRRAKKKVQDKLGIDENARKEVEEDVLFEEDD